VSRLQRLPKNLILMMQPYKKGSFASRRNRTGVIYAPGQPLGPIFRAAYFLVDTATKAKYRSYLINKHSISTGYAMCMASDNARWITGAGIPVDGGSKL
jgi:hypothetical protein